MILTNKITYLPLACLFPSQIRYARKNVEDKIQKALIKREAWFTPHSQTYCFGYDDNQSIFHPSCAIPIILTKKQTILADGHHSVLASLALGCKTIPTIPIAQWPCESDEAFWRWAEDHNYAYLWNLKGIKQPAPRSFMDLIDDPWRYFAAITARKFESSLDLAQSTGIEYPLWIKIGKDIPFMEMRIATTLYQAGFIYHYGQELTPQFTEMVEEARLILKSNPIEHLKLLPERVHYSKSSLLEMWLKEAYASFS